VIPRSLYETPFVHPLQGFLDCVSRYGDKEALIFEDGSQMTYNEMYVRVVEMCKVLKSKGLVRDDVIAVDAPRHLGLPIWIYAIWMLGGVYIALGSRDALDRKKRVIGISKAKCVIVEDLSDEVHASFSGCLFVSIHDKLQDEGSSSLFVGIKCDPIFGDVAYLPTTSGSTGEPKVIQISHRGLGKHIEGRQGGFSCLYESDRIMQSAMTSFDVHVYDNVAPFCIGAALILINESYLLNSKHLMNYLSSKECTYMNMVPSVWMYHCRSKSEFPRCLRICMFSGEKMKLENFYLLSKCFPESNNLKFIAPITVQYRYIVQYCPVQKLYSTVQNSNFTVKNLCAEFPQLSFGGGHLVS
jgi:pyochelin synthetase